MPSGCGARQVLVGIRRPCTFLAAGCDSPESIVMSFRIGSRTFEALQVDTVWLDHASLVEILRLARAGLPIILKLRPNEPGHNSHRAYEQLLDELVSLPSVVDAIDQASLQPLIAGDDLPWYRARESGEILDIFFAHPMAKTVTYPMRFGQSLCNHSVNHRATVHWHGWTCGLELRFKPYQSLAVRIDPIQRQYEFIDICYTPPIPREE